MSEKRTMLDVAVEWGAPGCQETLRACPADAVEQIKMLRGLIEDQIDCFYRRCKDCRHNIPGSCGLSDAMRAALEATR